MTVYNYRHSKCMTRYIMMSPPPLIDDSDGSGWKILPHQSMVGQQWRACVVSHVDLETVYLHPESFQISHKVSYYYQECYILCLISSFFPSITPYTYVNVAVISLLLSPISVSSKYCVFAVRVSTTSSHCVGRLVCVCVCFAWHWKVKGS